MRSQGRQQPERFITWGSPTKGGSSLRDSSREAADMFLSTQTWRTISHKNKSTLAWHGNCRMLSTRYWYDFQSPATTWPMTGSTWNEYASYALPTHKQVTCTNIIWRLQTNLNMQYMVMFSQSTWSLHSLLYRHTANQSCHQPWKLDRQRSDLKWADTYGFFCDTSISLLYSTFW